MSAATAQAFPEAHRIRTIEIRPRPQVMRNQAWSGTDQAVDFGPELWWASYQTAPLSDAQAAAWEVFLDMQRGGIGTCKAFDARRRFPASYPDGFDGMTILGGDPFTGVGEVYTTLPDRVFVQNLPVGMLFKPGDCFSAERLDGRAFFRVAEANHVNASGRIGLKVTLPVPPDLTINGEGTFDRPWFEAVLDQESVTMSSGVDQKTTVGFQVWQRHGR